MVTSWRDALHVYFPVTKVYYTVAAISYTWANRTYNSIDHRDRHRRIDRIVTSTKNFARESEKYQPFIRMS